MKTNSDNVIVITGCDSGIGRELAAHLAGLGYSVVASYLRDNPFKNSRHIITCKCDLRRLSDIERFARCVQSALRKGNQLYALVHNAGIAKGGPVENLPIAVYREVMEINFFGLVSLTEKLLPQLKRSKGKIVIHGSMAGRIALPFLSPYAASKFALEGFADSLRREMMPFGVQTTLLEIAAVATPIWNKAKQMKISDFPPAYRRSLKLFVEKFIDAGNRGMSQKDAAEQIASIVCKKTTRPRYIIAQSKILSRVELLIPDRLFDRICIRLFGMYYQTK